MCAMLDCSKMETSTENLATRGHEVKFSLTVAWEAWHLVTWTVTLRGRRGTYGTGLELVTRWGAAGLRLVAAHFA